MVLISLQSANGQNLYEEEKRKPEQEREIEEEEENDIENQEEQEERKGKAVEEEEEEEFIEQKNYMVGLSPSLMDNLYIQLNLY